jgi:hypothetical protein
MQSINNGKYGEEVNYNEEEFCKECGRVPCIMVEEEASFCAVSEMAKSMGKTNKEIRFMLYRHMCTVLHGYLGKHNRKELPLCVSFKIKEEFPEKNEDDYVGFRESSHK